MSSLGSAGGRSIGSAVVALALTALFLLPTAGAEAATRQVAATGTDTGSCLSSACRTFNYAYRQSLPGDVVQVAAGTYPGQAIPKLPGRSAPAVEFRPSPGAHVVLGGLDVAGNHVRFRDMETGFVDIDAGDYGATTVQDVTVVNGKGSGIWIQTARDVLFKGGSYGPRYNAPMVQIASAPPSYNLVFDGVDFHDAIATDPTVHMECIWAGSVQGFTVRNSIFRNCAYFDIFFTKLSGPDPKDVLLENNVFEVTKQSNGADAPYALNISNWLSKVENFTIRNNTFGGDVAIQPSTMINTRMVGNAGTVAACKSGVAYSHNVFTSTTCSFTDRQASGLMTQFVNPAAHDWRLKAGAAAIDSGNPNDHPLTDRAGLSRNGLPDAGAHEYGGGQGAPDPPPPPPGDTTAPSVAITSPTPGATLSGLVSVQASASDEVGITGVRFEVDGTALGAEDASVPYGASWDTREATPGQHTLTAVARDAAGNTRTSAPVVVTVEHPPVEDPPPSSGGLVAAYGFEEGGGATVTDLSGKGNTGTISGAARSGSGRHGSALSFDGVNDLVTVPDSTPLDLGSAMTLEAWVRPAAAGTPWRTVLLKEQPSQLAYALYSNTDTGRPSGNVFVGSDQDARGPAGLPLNTWTHLAATYGGGTLCLYVNGLQVASRALTGGIAVSSGALRIGGNAIWSEWFSGLIDEVRVYDRSLTAAEIQSDMNSPLADAPPAPRPAPPLPPPPPADSPPSVSITHPAAAALLSGAVSISAAAQDDRGVKGVRFRVDGRDLGVEDTAAPYEIPWETRRVGNGLHAVTAVARDSAGNVTTSEPVVVTVLNSRKRRRSDATASDSVAPRLTLRGSRSAFYVRVSERATLTITLRRRSRRAARRAGLIRRRVPRGTTKVRLSPRRFPPGRYRVTVQAKDAAGNASTRALSFVR